MGSGVRCSVNSEGLSLREVLFLSTTVFLKNAFECFMLFLQSDSPLPYLCSYGMLLSQSPARMLPLLLQHHSGIRGSKRRLLVFHYGDDFHVLPYRSYCLLLFSMATPLKGGGFIDRSSHSQLLYRRWQDTGDANFTQNNVSFRSIRGHQAQENPCLTAQVIKKMKIKSSTTMDHNNPRSCVPAYL